MPAATIDTAIAIHATSPTRTSRRDPQCSLIAGCRALPDIPGVDVFDVRDFGEQCIRRDYRLVEDGVFGSRSEALRYGARLVVREAHLERLHERADGEARKDVEERLNRKRVS